MQTEQAAHTLRLTKQESAAIFALLYFNMFDHPLTAEEIGECSSVPLEGDVLNSTLEGLWQKQLIYKLDRFYCLKNSPEMIAKRIKGNALADVYMSRAAIVSRFISWFPFVRGVIVSGSLSKHYMDQGSDIDFFIITEKSRLWVCRSMLAAWRKVMIGPLKKYFCINYFITADALKIPDENLFTATELVFMYPLYGKDAYERIMSENSWIKNYYPRKGPRVHNINNKKYPLSLKRAFEWLFKGALGEKLDTFLFRFMLKRWKKRYQNDFDETQFDLNIRTKKNVSKQHEKGHQFLILNKYKQQIDTFEQTHGITFTNV
jgi:hypothetical protein